MIKSISALIIVSSFANAWTGGVSVEQGMQPPAVLNGTPDPIGQYSLEHSEPTALKGMSSLIIGTERATNPTAPNASVQYLSADLTDSDNDGMTDEGELKYGFDPLDDLSFPTALPYIVEPEPTLWAASSAPSSAPNLDLQVEFLPTKPPEAIGDIIIYFNPPATGSVVVKIRQDSEVYYFVTITNGTALNLGEFPIADGSVLTIDIIHYGEDRYPASSTTEYIDLLTVDIPNDNSVIGDENNFLGYEFSSDFPNESEQQYRDLLVKLTPLLRWHLGPPAEKFNVSFEYTDTLGGTFMSVNNGRGVLTDGTFIPRLIVHELIHAWKGSYLISSDQNWNYQTDLLGFEEATAEGMAFIIMQDFVRTYPNDPVSLGLMQSPAYQYFSHKAHHIDFVKNLRATGGGDFFADTGAGMYYTRYSIAATVFQHICALRPRFFRDFSETYYHRINTDQQWRPNRSDIITMWEALVPMMNGYPLGEYLDTIPVFNGTKLDKGMYVLSAVRPYGSYGDFQFAPIYIRENGSAMWAEYPGNMTGDRSIPSWLRTVSSRGYTVVNTMDSEVLLTLRHVDGTYTDGKIYRTTEIFEDDGWPRGIGWFKADSYNMADYPLGLYKMYTIMNEFFAYDKGAREPHYFIGLQGLNQNRQTEYVILIGIDGVSNGLCELEIGDEVATAPVDRGVAVFRSTNWPFDLQTEITITVSKDNGESHSYRRTLIESASIHKYYQQQLLIVDQDFDGIEDQFDNVTRNDAEQCNIEILTNDSTFKLNWKFGLPPFEVQTTTYLDSDPWLPLENDFIESELHIESNEPIQFYRVQWIR